jgi:diacylglycerol kinase (ATP)
MRVILNPTARHGTGRRLRPVIERELARRGVDFDLVETAGPGHARELARAAAAAGVPRVIAAGGDGTVHEVANGMLDAGAAGAAAAMGLIPIGTGNDFVKMLPGTTPASAAFDTLAGGVTGAVDVGIVRWGGGEEHFVNAMGTGIDVEVVRRLRRSRWLPGSVIYVSALIRALVSYRAFAVRLTVDGTVVQRHIMNLAVCNGVSIGGSFLICPDARADDGLLDACLIGEMPVLRNARMVPRVISGTHAGHRDVLMLRGTAMHLCMTDGRPIPFQLDGELRHADDGAAGISIDIVPAGLNVIQAAPPPVRPPER